MNEIIKETMRLVKITTKEDEVADEKKKTYTHSFEGLENCKVVITLPHRLALNVPSDVLLCVTSVQSSLTTFVSEKEECVKKGAANQASITFDVCADDAPPEPLKGCKFLYKGGMCSNSIVNEPRCVGAGCEHAAMPPTEKKKSEKKNKKEGGDKIVPPAEPVVEESPYNEEYQGCLLIDKDCFPDVCGGLAGDVRVEKNMKENILYSHAKSKKKPADDEEKAEFSAILEDRTGVPWKWVFDKTWVADPDVLNKRGANNA